MVASEFAGFVSGMHLIEKVLDREKCQLAVEQDQRKVDVVREPLGLGLVVGLFLAVGEELRYARARLGWALVDHIHDCKNMGWAKGCHLVAAKTLTRSEV